MSDIWATPPTEDGWVKHFSDGTQELGYDSLIDNQKASWTRGRHDDIVGLALCWGEIVVYLVTEDGKPGKFWQSDDYECVFGNTKPVRVVRRIQMKTGKKLWKTLEIDVRSGEVKEFFSKHKI